VSPPYAENIAVTTAVVGAGCAGLTLSHQLSKTGATPLALIDPGTARADHIWGYWDDGSDDLSEARPFAEAAWQNWAFIDDQQRIVHHGQQYTYRALSSSRYEGHLNAALLADQTHTIAASVTTAALQADGSTRLSLDRGQQVSADMVIDCRAPASPKDSLLQHFGGWYVRMDTAVFDASTAILMDFRVSQEAGIHFIYLLPFSPTTALVESTVFSPSVLPASWYDQQVKAYLSAHYAGAKPSYEARESGVIPLAELHQPTPFGITLGLGAGALRASSGYAFSQIQRQASQFAERLNQGKQPLAIPGCSAAEAWMDRVFLRVLRGAPERGTEIFLGAANALNGDEFAQFMRGHAPWAVRLKLMCGLPVSLFLKAAMGARL
jgi:lycopene beta-cyclase